MSSIKSSENIQKEGGPYRSVSKTKFPSGTLNKLALNASSKSGKSSIVLTHLNYFHDNTVQEYI